jgi:hypothetical protein
MKEDFSNILALLPKASVYLWRRFVNDSRSTSIAPLMGNRHQRFPATQVIDWLLYRDTGVV